MVSKLNGAVLTAFKNEKSVKSLIRKRDEVFPSKFIEDTKSFMNKNFNKPNDTISVENEKIQEHQGNSNSLTTVTVFHTKTESSALNNIITSIKNHREIIPKYLEKI